MLHRRKGLPDDWERIVREQVAAWGLLDDDERALLGEIADWLLRHKHWEAANGFALTDEITVTIATQAALLVLGLGVDEYREVGAVIVYPTAMQSTGAHAGPASGTVVDGMVPVLGEAHDRRGPLLLAWDQAEDGGPPARRRRERRVPRVRPQARHANASSTGTPRLESREDVERWVEVCTDAYDGCAEGSTARRCGPTAPPTPPSSSPLSPRPSSTCRWTSSANEPELYTVLGRLLPPGPGRAGPSTGEGRLTATGVALRSRG